MAAASICRPPLATQCKVLMACCHASSSRWAERTEPRCEWRFVTMECHPKSLRWEKLHLWTRIHWSCTIVSIYCIRLYTLYTPSHKVVWWPSNIKQVEFERLCSLFRALESPSNSRVSLFERTERKHMRVLQTSGTWNWQQIGYPLNPERLCIPRDLPKLFGWSPHERKHMRIKKRLGKIHQHSTKNRPIVTASADAGSTARCHCPSVRKAKINDSAWTQQTAPWHAFQNKYSWSNKSLSEGNQHTESEIWNQVLKQLISKWKEKQRTHPGSIVIRHLRNQAAWQNSSDDCSVLNMLR